MTTAATTTTIEPSQYLTLAQLNAQLATVSVTSTQLQALGFKALKGSEICKSVDDPTFARKVRAALLYRHRDVERIRAAIARAMKCATGESYVIGNLLSIAPRYLPAGYSLTLVASPAGYSLSLQYPDGKQVPVNSEPPLSSCIKCAIECARADSVNAAKASSSKESQ